MRIFTRYIGRHKTGFVTAVLCVGCEALCDLMQPTLLSRLIDHGIRNGDMAYVIRLGLLMLSVTAIGALFAATRNILAGNVSQRIGADLRRDTLSKILSFTETSADKFNAGTLITRMTNDTAQVTQFMNGMMRIFVKAPVLCIGGIILSVSLNRQLGLLVIASVVLVSILLAVSMILSYTRFTRVQRAIDRVNTVVQEYLLGVRLVKAFGRGKEETEKFHKKNEELIDSSISSQLVIANFSPLITLTFNLGIAFVLYLGSVLVLKNDVQVGTISAFTTYMAQILLSMVMITNVFQAFVRAKASAERLGELMDEEGEKDTASGTKRALGQLTFEDVTFSYPEGSGIPSLQHLHFTVNPGEILAVIGPTGSGKSTILWLCLRFYSPDSGRILLDGRDLQEIPVGEIREAFSAAPQQSVLFSGTILENLRWGRSDATREDAQIAARAACADRFICEMPDGYDSLLGQGGLNLSGGQKQRLSLARAFLRQTPILLLDDCTSALDSVTESNVRESLRNLPEKPAILFVTQRVGSCLCADRILVLENGRAVGLGTHEDLLKNCPTYADIYDSQIGSDKGEEVV